MASLTFSMQIKAFPWPAIAISCATLTLITPASSQSFSSFPAGDDLTTSLGQFQLVLDKAWVRIFDVIITNSPLANTLVTRHTRLYHNGTLTSPTLYDPATSIGRSDSFVSDGLPDMLGTLAGATPGRTFIRDSQLTALPAWAETGDGLPEVHTFLKSLHLTDSITTRVGFSVKAGMQAPARPVSAGEVEAGSALSDFPARSFFNVFVVVDLPAGGLLPPIQLVNIDPLLVEQTNVFSFPPRIIYQHGNSTAVSMYFNTDVTIPDPIGGTNIAVTRGTLFVQLTLAWHGAGFGQAEVEAFQAEIENEMTNSMPINAAPIASVQVEDFSPDYNAALPKLAGGHIASDGSFTLTIAHLPADLATYLQVRTNLMSGAWQTIATIPPTTNSFTFSEPDASNIRQRFYRWTAVP